MEASVLQTRLRELLRDVILPSLERSFDAMDRDPDVVVHLGRMELTAAIPSLDAIGDALPALVERAVGDAVPAPEPATRSRAAILRAYVETGAFPWHANVEEIVAALHVEPALREELVTIAARAAETSPTGFVMLFRALQLLSESAWIAVARACAADPTTEEAMTWLALDRVLPRDGRLRFAAALLAHPLVDMPLPPLPPDLPPAIAACLVAAASPASTQPAPARMDEPEPAPASAGERTSPSTSERIDAPAPAPAPALGRARASEAADASTSDRIHEPAPTNELAPVHAPTNTTSTSTSPELRTLAESVHVTSPVHSTTPSPPSLRGDAAVVRVPAPAAVLSAPNTTFGLPASFAGLILLHPFLPRFFDQLGLQVVDDETRPRAAALLHACAAGKVEPLEHDLAFIKVLLGLAPDRPLLVGGGLVTAADLEEIDSLLRSVIGHWNALKNTSPNGLQATFLRRPGLIRADEHGYRLQVEPSPFDILLARLPWGFGVVKLAWMHEALVTEWPTP